MRLNVDIQSDELSTIDTSLDTAIARATALMRSHQTPAGYWWYTLEANETIGAEYIFLEHNVGMRTSGVWERLAHRMLQEQHADGSWHIAHGLPGDLSTTLECYVALRMAGFAADDVRLQRARRFIEIHGGVPAARIFTHIHFATLGLIPWDATPAMPVEVMLLPDWAPFSVYSFSSWARACIIPLLIVMTKRPVRAIAIENLAEEIGVPNHYGKKIKPHTAHPGVQRDMWGELFLWVDKILKITRPFTRLRPTKRLALRRAEEWIRTHIAETEDIFPALAYGALALCALGAATDDPSVAKALAALARFQHAYDGDALPERPFHAGSDNWQYQQSRVLAGVSSVHQQCCISPVWDTPWMLCALQAGDAEKNDADNVRGAQWLLTQQITERVGDWAKRNPHGQPGGWAFEFENQYFPDVDDTIQVVLALRGTSIVDEPQTVAAIDRAVAWCLSMHNDDGGWAAFDKNNSLELVNKIPFADHGACLDPSSPDITGRMLELLASHGYTLDHPVVQRAVRYLLRTQEVDGSWFGRWGVNYIYGTWAVLTGLAAIGFPPEAREISRAAQWLTHIQQVSGGFGESVLSYPRHAFVPAAACASQTAWALMGLIAAGKSSSDTAQRAARFLLERQRRDGGWDEASYTGTGFPGHFYIRYHGYRHYFPLLALGKWRKAGDRFPIS